jgi:hypothetical protein
MFHVKHCSVPLFFSAQVFLSARTYLIFGFSASSAEDNSLSEKQLR